MASFTVVFNAFRFYAEGTESGSTALANENASLQDNVADFAFQLRVLLQETAGKNGSSSDAYQLQYRKNGGTWTNVTTTSSNVKAYNSGDLTDGSSTTKRLSAGNGSFVAGKVSETGSLTHALTANNHTEHVYSLQFVESDLVVDDSLEFRILFNSETFTYNVTPEFKLVNLPPEQPTVYTEDAAEFSTGRPSFEFSAVDLEGDDVTYELAIFSKDVVGALFTSYAKIKAFNRETLAVEAEMDIPVSHGMVVDGGNLLTTSTLYEEDSKYYFLKIASSLTGFTVGDAFPSSDLDQSVLAVDEDWLFAALGITGEAATTLAKVNKETLEIESYADGASVRPVLLGECGDYLFYGGALSSNIFRAKKSDLSADGSLETEGSVLSISVDHVEDKVYVTSGLSNGVRIINPNTMTLIGDVFYPEDFLVNRVLVVGDYFYVGGIEDESPQRTRLLKYDKTTLGLAGNLLIDSTAIQVRTMVTGGGYIFLSFRAHDKLVRVDLSSFTITGTFYHTVDGIDQRVTQMVCGDTLERIHSAKSAEDSGFENVDNPSNTDPFNSGDKIKYTVPEGSEIEEGEYTWQVRGKDV